MKSLEISMTSGPDGKTILFKGVVDEYADFSKLDVSGDSRLVFDLGGVRLINSLGIRSWTNWLKSLGRRAIVFRRCSKPIVDQMNILEGFVPLLAIVESFFVPYHCGNCDNVSQLLFKSGVEFTPGTADQPERVSAPEKVICEKCRGPMELDVIEPRYFRFLKYRR